MLVKYCFVQMFLLDNFKFYFQYCTFMYMYNTHLWRLHNYNNYNYYCDIKMVHEIDLLG